MAPAAALSPVLCSDPPASSSSAQLQSLVQEEAELSCLLPAPHGSGLCSLPGAPTALGACPALGPLDTGRGELQRAQAFV